uniref:Glycosyl transferase family 1 n=1 Tax=Thermogemmatispora argillosa TaxID=2045280 RepID=A0A455T4G4_9CHLR|nr:glycosyl transferase family 1 [Thermogemmatispora argillosa]
MTIVTTPGLERFRGLVSDDLLAEIYDLARPLQGLHVLHINTTAQGGGVAALLRVLLPLVSELGIPHTWRVVQLNEFAATFMARLTDMLQGGEPGQITPDDQRQFLDSLQSAMQPFAHERADLYYVHDIQLAPLGQLFPHLRPALWFNHIDTAQPNPVALQYISQFLDAYALCTFNTPFSIFPQLPAERVAVITLGIDPFSERHVPLSEAEGQALLASCGIDPGRPLITQVSRFGRWKNPWQVIEIYRLVKQRRPDVQVALVGALEASDDIRAQAILADLQQWAGDDPDIHLLWDPAQLTAPVVNAFQRFSQVILQRSSREGFGLTVAEAMWKYQPVVGTSATGVRYQITHGRDGFIADDAASAADYTLYLLEDRERWRQMGEAAHRSVQERFLLPLMLRDYLAALRRVQHLVGRV